MDRVNEKPQMIHSSSLSLPQGLSFLWAQTITLACLGSLVLALSAQIQIPLPLVPITMQPVAVMVLGLICPPRLALAAVSAYVLEGCIGLPVFAGFSGGARIMLGPTSGYIVGFIPQVLIVALVAQACRGKRYELLGQIIGLVMGQAVLYACGVAVLSGFVGFKTAIATGVLPFLPKCPINIALALMVAWGYGFCSRRSSPPSTRPAAA